MATGVKHGRRKNYFLWDVGDEKGFLAVKTYLMVFSSCSRKGISRKEILTYLH